MPDSVVQPNVETPLTPSSESDKQTVQHSPFTPKSGISAEVKQSNHTQIGGARQPAFAPVEQEEKPDVKKVKEMLRTSGKERPPGL
jgi:hypothetical protein